MFFDRDELQKILKDKNLKGQDGLQEVLRNLTKEVIEALYEGELTDHLGYPKHKQNSSHDGNNRNGKSKKSVQSSFGEIDLAPPRDRLGTFDPQVVKKRQNDITGIEAKVISMYAKGMSTRDISSHIYDIYGYELSAETISTITDKVLEKAREWQSRPLEPVYAIVFMDGMVIKMRVDGTVQNVTVYFVIGIDLEGNKSCLGLYLAESESSKYWLTVMNELKNRGVEDILIFAVDNLSGISEAILSAFPKAEIQKCVVHQIRNSLRFVPWKERKTVASDLKLIYKASTIGAAEDALDLFSEKWDKKYPHISKSWKSNWTELSTFFRYSPEIRKLIYTTNAIESFNRGIRKVTKTRAIFPTQDAALKLIYLAIQDIEKKWIHPIRDWGIIYSQLTIYFEERLEKYL
ncbi:IS256 family transposase [archaeon]|nr:IS256 family transposase [archaeon]